MPPCWYNKQPYRNDNHCTLDIIEGSKLDQQNNAPQRINRFSVYHPHRRFQWLKMSWNVGCVSDALVREWNKSELVFEETLVTVVEFVQSRESVAEKNMTKLPLKIGQLFSR